MSGLYLRPIQSEFSKVEPWLNFLKAPPLILMHNQGREPQID